MSAPCKVTIDFTLPPLPSIAKWLIRAVIFARCANFISFLFRKRLIHIYKENLMKIKDNLLQKRQPPNYDKMTSMRKQDLVLFIYKMTTWLSFLQPKLCFELPFYLKSPLLLKRCLFETWLCFLA